MPDFTGKLKEEDVIDARNLPIDCFCAAEKINNLGARIPGLHPGHRGRDTAEEGRPEKGSGEMKLSARELTWPARTTSVVRTSGCP
jgi:hypothetical protein